jgi:hypothetical protein
VQRIAKRIDLVGASLGSLGPRQMDAHCRLAIPGQRVSLRREIEIAGGLGSDRCPQVCREQSPEEAHALEIYPDRDPRPSRARVAPTAIC